MGKLDIVVCTKNNEATIRESLQRILAYGAPARLIVVDGKSTDRTIQIASSMGALICTDEGKGLGHARNMALKLVETPIFGFVDADAFIPQNWTDLLKHMTDPAVAAASATTIYGYGNPPLQKLHEWMSHRNSGDVGFVSTVARRSTLLGVGGIREDLTAYEDWELNTRLRLHGYRWICDREVVTIHPQSLNGFLSHARRWGRGARRSGVKLNRLTRPFLTSPFWGLKLAILVHPIHAIYYPLLRLEYLLGYIEAR